ncbi:MAG: hypothetical protein JXK94_05745 [Deltaproteobacteria bacterium]|nr:hypothetical protein [Deltaproteobacteria bacterium]
MPVIELSAGEWLSIITHIKQWVGNLLRAKEERKQESKDALRSVIKAVRETTLYLHRLREGEGKSLDMERELSHLWTDLSFRVEDLKLNKLAERCNLMGKYWADPTLFDPAFLDQANERLADVEKLARLSLEQNSG